MAPPLRIQVRHGSDLNSLEVDLEDGIEVLRCQIFSLTFIPPEEQVILGIGSGPLPDDVDLTALGIKEGQEIRVMQSVEYESKQETANEKSLSERNYLDADEEFARMLQAEEDAAMAEAMAQAEASMKFLSQSEHNFENDSVQYEDEGKQRKARSLIPIHELEEKAAIALAKTGLTANQEEEMPDAILQQLLVWFKTWFSWVNSPSCEKCGSETRGTGSGNPTPEDLKYQGFRVENYRCLNCGAFNRFVRYNDPEKLLETRRGRCGEWANCFTLCCRALGYEAREISNKEGEDGFLVRLWIGPIMCGLNATPLTSNDGFISILVKQLLINLFFTSLEGKKPGKLKEGKGWERRWGKKLIYVIAFSSQGVCDVTKRYTRKWDEVLTRRNEVPEDAIPRITLELTASLRANLNIEKKRELERRDILETQNWEIVDQIQRESLPGRQTGSLEWRKVRGELGESSGNVNLTSNSSNLKEKLARDEHLGKIFLAFGDLCKETISENSSDVVYFLTTLQNCMNLLSELKLLPYRNRNLKPGTRSNPSKHIQTLKSRATLSFFEALGLGLFTGEKEGLKAIDDLEFQGLDEGKTIWFSPKTSPISVAVALPVADILLREGIQIAKKSKDVRKSVLESISSEGFESKLHYLMKGELITGGRVCADGENPSESAVEAFDGQTNSKWLHPENVTKGAWLQYRLLPGKSAILAAYVLTSANDCPERDPRDWKLEGTTDEGTTWHILDERRSEVFKNRYFPKLYEISASQQKPCSIFRLSVSSVGKTDACLQLSSMELFELREKENPLLKSNIGETSSSTKENELPETSSKKSSEEHLKLSQSASVENQRSRFAELIRLEFEIVRKAEPQLSVNQVAVEAFKRVKSKMG